MKLWRIVCWSCILFLSLLLLLLSTNKVEGFYDELLDNQKKLEKDITNAMILFGDAICPAQKDVLQSKMEDFLDEEERDKDVADRDSKKVENAKYAAEQDFAMKIYNVQTQQGFPSSTFIGFENKVFKCPPVKDPYKIPNNIDEYIVRTCTVLTEELQKMINKLMKKRNDCQQQTNKETFVPYPLSEFQEGFDENETEYRKMVIQQLTVKNDALKRAIQSPEFATFKAKYAQVKELKEYGRAQTSSGNSSPDYNMIKPVCN